ncbi:MAG TPA: histidine phosphatase family protein [Burkholderiales bacterium]
MPRWPLSDLGKKRMRAGLAQPWVREVTAIYCSTEQKAIDGAEILAQHLGLRFTEIPALGENDRSATGFLPPDEFERVADQFFASPHESVRGWERAIDAQVRVVQAIEQIDKSDNTAGAIAIVAHGAVGTLLYCHLAGEPISRRWDQPPNGGGNYYRFTLSPRAAHFWWRAIDG